MITKDEIKQYVKDYAQAAKNFVEKAGGDGVESESGDVQDRVRTSYTDDTTSITSQSTLPTVT